MVKLEELMRQLTDLRSEKKRVRDARAAAKQANKPLWAFSPSGKWLPGLWSGPWDRDSPILNSIGAPPHSISFVKELFDRLQVQEALHQKPHLQGKDTSS